MDNVESSGPSVDGGSGQEDREASPDDNLLLNPKQAAKRLGISLGVFKRRAIDGFYPPTQLDARGWRYYSVRDIENFRAKMSSTLEPVGPRIVQPAIYDAATSTKVFKALNEGKNPAEVVADLNVHALQVRHIYGVWLELRGCVHLTPEEVSRINALRLEGEFPVRSGGDLVRNLELLARRRNPACLRCKVAPKSVYCTPCAEHLHEERLMKDYVQEPAPPPKGKKGKRADNAAT